MNFFFLLTKLKSLFVCPSVGQSEACNNGDINPKQMFLKQDHHAGDDDNVQT